MKDRFVVYKYYLYGFAVSMRLTRIVKVLYLIQYAGMNLVQFALLQSIFSLSQFIMEVPAGILGDKIKKKTILIIGLSLAIISQLTICSKYMFNVDIGFIGLGIGFMIEGIARAFISGADEALFFEALRENGFKEQYDKIVGKNRLFVAISLGLAALVGAVLYEVKPSLPYTGQIVMTIMAIIIVASIKEPLSTTESKEQSTVKSILTNLADVKNNPKMLYMIIYFAVITAVVNTLFGIMPDYINEIGFTPSQNGGIFLALSLISGIVASQAYRLSKSTYGKLVLITSICIGLGTFFICTETNKIIVFAGLALWYVTIDILDPIMMKVLNFYVEDDIRATFLSSVSFLTYAIMMILYPIIGASTQYMGMESTLITVTTVILMLSAISYMISLKYTKKVN